MKHFFFSSVSSEVESAAVKDHSKPRDHKGAARQVFMPESDASSFIKHRSRRSTRYYEIQIEQRVKIAASEQRREYNEEQRTEQEHYVEEVRDGETWTYNYYPLNAFLLNMREET
ncbi:hypothetical protein JOQ06_003779 [Pogonophryne albipinna]|uniref:Unique cartilage matrix-associated protein n=1 Tax=Pogonophryne albipinna TaxID=1090488 RepID=A0AAD6AGF0_9TELE|nr:hypothetical protein JOQ06_003779 [Pogonophryne albipinna]